MRYLFLRPESISPGLIGLMTAVFFLSACAAPMAPETIRGAGTYQYRMNFKTGGFQRSYRVHVPPGYDGAHRLPLVVVLHGAFDTAKGMEKYSGFSRLADRERFIVLYPEGIGILGLLQHWNAGHCCGKAAREEIDDVGYLAAAINDVCSRLSVDRRRIYMTGFSNGGMMTYRFAAQHADMLAAAAPIAASIGGRPSADVPEWRIPKPGASLPILIIHGLADEDVPFEGGHPSSRKSERTYFSVADSVRFWVAADRCSGGPIDSTLAGGAVKLSRWFDCRQGASVVLCRIAGWGHTWPGPAFTATLPADDPLLNFDAAEMIWNFFKQFP